MSNDDPYVGLEPSDYAPVPDDPSDVSVAELMQNQLDDLPAVPIRQTGPLNVRKMGNKDWIGGNTTLDATITTNAYRILNSNPNRARAVVWSSAAGANVGRSQAEATLAGAALPLGVPIYMEHVQEVWVRLATGTATISWFEEVWAE